MTDDELKRLIEGSAAETRRHVDVVVAELRQENVETRRELRQENVDTRRHFDVVVEEFKGRASRAFQCRPTH